MNVLLCTTIIGLIPFHLLKKPLFHHQIAEVYLIDVFGIGGALNDQFSLDSVY